MEITTITSREEWLKERLNGIGGSECSAIIGKNPYMSNVELWKLKTGRKQAQDISNKACVQYGIAAEAPLRELFALDYPEYKVEYGGAFDMIRNDEHPFIYATLDGRLTEIATGRKGIYEGKTTEILRSMQKEKWRDKIPDNYYCQVLWQLIATGWDFVALNAQLKRQYYKDVRCETRRYFFEKEEVMEDMEYLKQEAIKFWEYVKLDKEPPLLLPSL